MVFLKEFFENVDFEKRSANDKNPENNYPACKELNSLMHMRSTAISFVILHMWTGNQLMHGPVIAFVALLCVFSVHKVFC